MTRLTDFYRGLAVLLRAGVALPEALKQLGRDGGLPDWLGEGLARETGSGRPLSAALSMHAGSVPPEDVALIEAGETTGHLDENLDRLAQLHEERRQARALLFRQCAYPILLFHMAALMVPIGTLGAAGRLSLTKSFAITLAIVLPAWGLVVAIYFLRRRADWRSRFAAWLDAIPGFGTAARHRRHALFATVLDAGYEAGMRLDRALDLAVTAASAATARPAVAQVEQGQPLAVAMAPSGFLGSRNLARIATAETAGELSTELRMIAREEFAAAEAALGWTVGIVSKGFYVLIVLWIVFYALSILSQAYSVP